MGRLLGIRQKTPETTQDHQAYKPLTAKQLRAYPESARKVILPTPTTQGEVQVGASRGRPFKLHYKLYGSGPAKILWLYGHGDQISSWHRYIRHFSVPKGDRYTSLFIQARGVKESEGPLGLWSMKDLAADAFDLLNELKWTEDRSIHVLGHSMGGMQAQELAMLCPSRIGSLTLVATTSNWMADMSLLKCAKEMLSVIIPTPEDGKIAQMVSTFFGKAWPGESDQEAIFPTNGDNWTARDYLNMDIQYKGVILQIPACVWHRVAPDDLRKLGQDIGGSRIQVLHGHSDTMVPFTAGQSLCAALSSEGNVATLVEFEDTGHILPTERYAEVVKLLEAMIART